MTAPTVPRALLITGIMAAGKSTIAQALAELRERTPRLGLWLDTTELSPSETVDTILARPDQTIVRP